MQKIILIIALSSISICFAITEADLSNRIIIDEGTLQKNKLEQLNTFSLKVELRILNIYKTLS